MSQVTLYPPGTTVGSSAYAYCVVLGGSLREEPRAALQAMLPVPHEAIHSNRFISRFLDCCRQKSAFGHVTAF